MYTAQYLPNYSISKSGFLTEQEAIDYVATQLCLNCKQELEQGFALYGNGEITERVPVDDALCTGCGSEWIVGLTSEIEAAETFEDMLSAGGWKKIEDPSTILPKPKEECDHDLKFEAFENEDVVWKCSKCKSILRDNGLSK